MDPTFHSYSGLTLTPALTPGVDNCPGHHFLIIVHFPRIVSLLVFNVVHMSRVHARWGHGAAVAVEAGIHETRAHWTALQLHTGRRGVLSQTTKHDPQYCYYYYHAYNAHTPHNRHSYTCTTTSPYIHKHTRPYHHAYVRKYHRTCTHLRRLCCLTIARGTGRWTLR